MNRLTIPWHRLMGVPLGAALIVLAGCQPAPDDVTPSPSEASASPSPSLEPSVAPSASPTDSGAGEETSVFEIEVGDCFTADSGEIATVIVIDCNRPHTYEVFHVFDHEAGPDDAYPGDEEILDYADTQCQQLFEEYVGTDYETSVWFIASVTPSAETWLDGDREIICTLDQQDDDGVAIEVTGSAAGSAE
jgi:hypothetical protein